MTHDKETGKKEKLGYALNRVSLARDSDKWDSGSRYVLRPSGCCISRFAHGSDTQLGKRCVKKSDKWLLYSTYLRPQLPACGGVLRVQTKMIKISLRCSLANHERTRNERVA